MKNKLLFPILISTFLLVGCSSPTPPEPEEPTLIYFDTEAEEAGDGSIETPYNDIERLTTLSIGENTHILIKNGSFIETPLVFSNLKGSAGKEIVVTSYGTGEKPLIRANSLTNGAVVKIDSCAYFTFDGFEITDPNESEGERRGILITSSPNHLAHYDNITVSNNYIHDIHGITDVANRGMSNQSKCTGGIHVWSENGNGVYSNLKITRNTITRVDNAGIASRHTPYDSGITSPSPYEDSLFERFAYKNVEISYNTISYIGKNAIFVRNIKGGSIDHNTVFETAIKAHAGNSIVTSRVDNMVVEYNEGYLNRADNTDGKDFQDGCMIDPDLQTRNVLVQYNYSHDNSFGLFLNCNAENKTDRGAQDKATVRFNLSVNDYGMKGIFYINYYIGQLDIYNNTVISAKSTKTFFKSNDNRTFNFRGNIIYDLSQYGSFEIGQSSYGFMEDNCYYNVWGNEPGNFSDFTRLNNTHEDPEFYNNPYFAGIIDPESTIEERTGMDKIAICELSSSSSLINRGLQEQGVTQDILGNPYHKTIGCYCK